MSVLNLAEAIDRMKENEERLDLFINGDENDQYVSTEGDIVPSIQKFLAQKDEDVNSGIASVLANVTELAAETADNAAIATSAKNVALLTANTTFNTVPLLMTDTTMGYVIPALVIVAAGQRVLAGGYEYTVAASSATDHDLTNGGSVKFYVAGPVKRLGAWAPDSSGVTDVTAKLKSWLKAADRDDAMCVNDIGPNAVFLTGEIDLNADGLPGYIEWNNCQLKAKAGATGTMLSMVNPHVPREAFYMGPLRIDCDYIAAHGFYLNGLNEGHIGVVTTVKALLEGNIVYGCDGAGVYYSRFDGFIGEYCDSHGNYIHSSLSEDANRNSANSWGPVQGRFNLGDGARFRYVQGEIPVSVEKNNGYGYYIDGDDNPTYSLTITGYAENNHRGMARSVTPDGTPDWYCYIGANARGVKIVSGRMVGDYDPTSPGIFNAGMEISPTNAVRKILGMGLVVGNSANPRDIELSGDLEIAGDLVFTGAKPKLLDITAADFSGDNLSIPAASSVVVVATRADLGTNTAWEAYVRVDGANHGQAALIWATGASGNPVLTVTGTLGSFITWSIIGATVAIANSDTSARTVDWRLVRRM